MNIKSKNTITVGVIGLGYVGLPLAMLFIKNKILTYGFDIDQNKIDNLKEGKSYIGHINSNDINSIDDNYFKPTIDFSKD